MRRTMIVVSGKANSGKTTTIRLAYEMLKPSGVPVLNFLKRPRKEVIGILEIKGMKVGFCSRGDQPLDLEVYLELLIEEGCVVIVCASHTRKSRTVEVVERLAREARPPFSIDWTVT